MLSAVTADFRVSDIFKSVAGFIALGVEAAGTLIVTFGAVEALYGATHVILRGLTRPGERRVVWTRFAGWLLLGLEFELAADIVRTAISPTWNDIGQLAAIGVIRTFLNYYLEKDVGESKHTITPASSGKDDAPSRPLAA